MTLVVCSWSSEGCQKAALTDEPSRLLTLLQVTGSNYDVNKTSMENWYDNKRLMSVVLWKTLCLQLWQIQGIRDDRKKKSSQNEEVVFQLSTSWTCFERLSQKPLARRVTNDTTHFFTSIYPQKAPKKLPATCNPHGGTVCLQCCLLPWLMSSHTVDSMYFVAFCWIVGPKTAFSPLDAQLS